MANGKTIKLFLVDGTYDGTVVADIHNWSGKGIKVGRDDSALNSLSDLQNPGVYFLFCGGPSDGVYIGESQDVLRRLKQHKTDYNAKKEKFFWTTALCFVDPTLIINTKYLEARLVDDATNARVYNVLTKSSGIPPINAAAKSDNETFIEYVKALVGTLGYQVFTNNAAIAKSNPSNVYTLKSKAFDAKMVITATGFVVLSGSKLSSTVSKSMPKGLLKMRNDLIKKGIIDSNFVLQHDQTFGSVSSAAKFVACYSIAGTNDWKDSNGVAIGNKTI